MVPPPNVGGGIRKPEQESDFFHRKDRPGLGLGAFGGDFLYAVHKNRGGVKIPVLCVCGERGQDRQSLVTGRNGAFSGLLKPIQEPGQRVIVQPRKGGLVGLYALFLLKIGQQQPECIFVRACLKSSNKDGDESKSKHLSRNKEFSLTIFPKSAEFVEPAEKTLYHPAAWQNDKLV